MLISHRKKFIYTKTIKTGGTSVEAYFDRYCMAEGTWEPTHARDESISEFGIIGSRGQPRPRNATWYNHMPALLLRQLIGESLWQAYFKFCVVRNPFDKALSAFYFFRTDTPPSWEGVTLDEERAAFERWLLAGKNLPIDRDKYLIDGSFCLDFALRHERLSEDMAHLCGLLDIDWDPALLPRFKGGLRPGFATPAAMYSPPARRSVEKAFAFELAHFGYAFPEDTPDG
jgi:hypothetical protein